MDAVEYLKEKARMTDDCNAACWECPFSEKNNCKKINCAEFQGQFPVEAVTIVEKWSREHPAKTFADVFFEKFPNAQRTMSNVPPFGICPDKIFKIEKVCNSSISCTDCWNREYEEATIK
jgi:hypothetical protein